MMAIMTLVIIIIAIVIIIGNTVFPIEYKVLDLIPGSAMGIFSSRELFSDM